jgi:hypothetical protein
VTPDQIPQELVDILNADAGKEHGREGRVLATLAKILTRYDAMRTNVNVTNIIGDRQDETESDSYMWESGT